MTIAKLEARCVLLDIEGTISDIRFVYDVMFPYAKAHMDRFLAESWSTPAVQDAIRTVAKDAGTTVVEDWLGGDWKAGPRDSIVKLKDHLQQLMSTDSKATGLKLLQGMVWQNGFESGALRA